MSVCRHHRRRVVLHPSTKEHPLIFTAESVRAILAGRKRQTRRPITRGNSLVDGYRATKALWESLDWSPGHPDRGFVHPIWQPGDRLWVKELWCHALTRHDYTGKDSDHGGAADPCCGYPATMTYRCGATMPSIPRVWRSPRFMPRKYSRLILDLTAVAGEFLQDITGNGAYAEGFETQWTEGADSILRNKFADAWDAINAHRGYPWDSNPPVWVLTFEKREPPDA